MIQDIIVRLIIDHDDDYDQINLGEMPLSKALTMAEIIDTYNKGLSVLLRPLEYPKD